ncbi:MAG: hypothetical protein MJ078_02415 [Clostridia bacterium]|nr:hypothetical protein [Clostridia bacterium]
MNEEKREQPGEIAATPLMKKLDNFWYHYKWQTLFGLFALVTAIILIVQFSGREKTDMDVLYAGPAVLRTQTDITDVQNAFSHVAKDVNGDKKTSVGIVSYFYDMDFLSDPDNRDADIGLIKTNMDSNLECYLAEVQTGDIQLFMVSPYLFELVEKENGFVDAKELCPDLDLSGCFYVDENGEEHTAGVLLSSLPFGELAGLSDLPADTVLCLRKPSLLQGWFNRSHAKENHENAADAFVRAIRFGRE